jgi:hypothetical protein
MFTAIVVIMVVLFGVEAASYGGASLPSQPTETQSTPGLVGPWVSSADGIRLEVTLNATTINVHQELNVTMALFNTYGEPDSVPTMNSVNWSIGAFPVEIWPGCLFSLPIGFVIVQGNYTLADFMATRGNTTVGYLCMGGYGIDHVDFQPNSDIAVLTGTYSQGGGEQALGPYRLSTNFTVSGYWDYPINATEAQDIYTPYNGGVTFRYPEVSPIPAHVFVPGVYTLVTVDEWGQSVILHFTVVSS